MKNLKDLKRAAAVLLVFLFVSVSMLLASGAALADTASDMANLTNTIQTLLIAIIPLIIVIGIFTFILTKLRFGPK